MAVHCRINFDLIDFQNSDRPLINLLSWKKSLKSESEASMRTLESDSILFRLL